MGAEDVEISRVSTATRKDIACPTCGANMDYALEGALHCRFCEHRGEQQPQPVVRG